MRRYRLGDAMLLIGIIAISLVVGAFMERTRQEALAAKSRVVSSHAGAFW